MDIERFVAERLMDTTGIKTVLEVPEIRPGEFVSVQRTGGPEKAFSDHPTLAVQSWAKTRRRASEMARSVNNALKGLMALGCCLRGGHREDRTQVARSRIGPREIPDGGQHDHLRIERT